MTPINRSVFFDRVREAPFPGTISEDQVGGMSYILDVWERDYPDEDLRWLAYALATTFHETASEMQPISEYGEGAGQPYGETDPETKQEYYGRGFVQLTWRENYARADRELKLEDAFSCEKTADNALKPGIAAEVMFQGMITGWFRADDAGPQTLPRYFSASANDPFNAREIINGDRNLVPDWSNGLSIGALIADYHNSFFSALVASIEAAVPPPPPEEILSYLSITIDITVRGSGPVTFEFTQKREADRNAKDLWMGDDADRSRGPKRDG